jgi:hypothetical protein
MFFKSQCIPGLQCIIFLNNNKLIENEIVSTNVAFGMVSQLSFVYTLIYGRSFFMQ